MCKKDGKKTQLKDNSREREWQRKKEKMTEKKREYNREKEGKWQRKREKITEKDKYSELNIDV